MAQFTLYSNFQTAAAPHYRATTNICNWLVRRTLEDSIIAFKVRHALILIPVGGSCVCGFDSGPCVCVELHTEARSEQCIIASAEEPRIIDAENHDESIAHDPFIDRANRHLPQFARRFVWRESECW